MILSDSIYSRSAIYADGSIRGSASLADLLSGRAVLREGDAGPLVGKMQQALTALGYDVGPQGVDGRFGPDTRAAVVEFQGRNDLAELGFLGAETARSLWVDDPVPGPGLGYSATEDTLRAPTLLPAEQAEIARWIGQEPLFPASGVDPMLAAALSGTLAATWAMERRPNYRRPARLPSPLPERIPDRAFERPTPVRASVPLSQTPRARPMPALKNAAPTSRFQRSDDAGRPQSANIPPWVRPRRA